MGSTIRSPIQWVTVLALLAAYLWLPKEVYLSDSEFYSLLRSNFIEDIFTNGFKPLFYVVIQVFQFDHAYINVIGARYIFLFILILNSIFAIKILESIFGKSQLNFMAVLTLLCSSIYIERFFRVRSDYLALLFQMGFLSIIFYLIRERLNIRDIFRYGFLLFILEALMVLSTYKALYMVIIQNLALLLFVTYHNEENIRRILALKWIALLSSLAIILLLDFNFVSNKFESLFAYLIESYSGGLGMPPFMELSSWIHILDFLIKNPILTLVFGLLLCKKLSYSTIGLKKNKEEFSLSLSMTYTSFLGVILFPEKYPYFICALLFFPLIFMSRMALQGLKEIFESRVSHRDRLFFLNIIAIFCLIKSSFYAINTVTQNSNDAQIQFINEWESYFSTHRNITYFDSIGLIKSVKVVNGFLGPNQSYANREMAKQLRRQPPDVLVLTNKLLFLKNDLGQILTDYYSPIIPGIYVRSGKVFPHLLPKYEMNNLKYIEIHVEDISKYLKVERSQVDSGLSSAWKENKIYFYFNEDGQTKEFSHGEVLLKKDNKLYPYTGQESLFTLIQLYDSVIIPEKNLIYFNPFSPNAPRPGKKPTALFKYDSRI